MRLLYTDPNTVHLVALIRVSTEMVLRGRGISIPRYETGRKFGADDATGVKHFYLKSFALKLFSKGF